MGFRLQESWREDIITGLNKASFREAIIFAVGRAANCQAQKAAEKSSDDSTPGKSKDDRKWNTWMTEFHDMLRARLRFSGVLLSYSICENDDPEPGEHQTYKEKCKLRRPQRSQVMIQLQES